MTDQNKLAVTTNKDSLFKWAKNWADANFLWSFPVGSDCCSLELNYIANGEKHPYLRPFPGGRDAKGADVLLVSGIINKKMAPYLKKTYEQLNRPCWVIAIGACAISGAPFKSYASVAGLEELFPVDIIIPGCPPGPEAIFQGIEALKENVQFDLGLNATIVQEPL